MGIFIILFPWVFLHNLCLPCKIFLAYPFKISMELYCAAVAFLLPFCCLSLFPWMMQKWIAMWIQHFIFLPLYIRFAEVRLMYNLARYCLAKNIAFLPTIWESVFPYETVLEAYYVIKILNVLNLTGEKWHINACFTCICIIHMN